MNSTFKLATLSAVIISALTAACGPQPGPAGNSNQASVNTNTNTSTSTANTNSASGATVDTREPEQYKANIRLQLELTGNAQQSTAIPALGAMVARDGGDRVMEFTLPTNEKVVYLDKAGVSYLILPNRRQYAELGTDATGFEVRRLMMPSEIVSRLKAIPGVRIVGEETVAGRTAVKYAYQAAANTGTQAGTVATESFMLVDKETGLPLRTETISQSQSGGSVQGVTGGRMITEMTEISTSPDPAVFALPTDYQKIDAESLKAQVTAVFSVIGNLIGQSINQPKPPPATANSAANTTQR